MVESSPVSRHVAVSITPSIWIDSRSLTWHARADSVASGADAINRIRSSPKITEVGNFRTGPKPIWQSGLMCSHNNTLHSIHEWRWRYMLSRGCEPWQVEVMFMDLAEKA